MAANKFAKMYRGIWLDDDWLDLSIPAQWLYQRLVTGDLVGWAGAGRWEPETLTQSAIGSDVELLDTAAAELEERLFVIFDRGTREFLIRTYVRNNDLMRVGNMPKAIGKAFAVIGSRRLRGVFVNEMLRYQQAEPGLRWEDVADVLSKRSIDPRAPALKAV